MSWIWIDDEEPPPLPPWPEIEADIDAWADRNGLLGEAYRAQLKFQMRSDPFFERFE